MIEDFADIRLWMYVWLTTSSRKLPRCTSGRGQRRNAGIAGY
jgi:hypothetical protein